LELELVLKHWVISRFGLVFR